MSSNKKEIKINPELFNISGKKKKEKTKRTKPINIKPMTIKRDLIKRIRERKNLANNSNDSLKNSIKLFKEVSEEKKNSIPQQKEVRINTNENMQSVNMQSENMQSVNMQSENMQSVNMQSENMQSENMQSENMQSVNMQSENMQEQYEVIQPVSMNTIDPPPYSNLKNSIKPTYREWKSTTQKRPHPVVLVDSIKEKKPTNRKVKHYTKLGKRNKTISILIKDRETRKKIDNELNLLKKEEISKIKEYLRERGLIKIGSHAPEHIVRETYENAFLAGDIKNTSKDTLIHNYMNT